MNRLEFHRSRRFECLENSPSEKVIQPQVSQGLSNIAMVAVSATSVNPCCAAIDLETDSGKKIFNITSKGLPECQIHTGGPNTMLLFLKKCKLSGKKFWTRFSWSKCSQRHDNNQLLSEPRQVNYSRSERSLCNILVKLFRQ